MDLLKKSKLTLIELGSLCLSYLIEDPEQLARFMTAAGYDPDGLRAALGSESLALGLVDYFATNEALLVPLCAANKLRTEDFMRVWQKHNPGA